MLNNKGGNFGLPARRIADNSRPSCGASARFERNTRETQIAISGWHYITKGMLTLAFEHPCHFPKVAMVVALWPCGLELLRIEQFFQCKLPMQVHGIGNLFTLNFMGFRRFSGIAVVSPEEVLALLS
jgi:hypothetical protein